MDSERFLRDMWRVSKLVHQSVEELFVPAANKAGLSAFQAQLIGMLAMNQMNQEMNTIGNITKKLGMNQGNVSAFCKRAEQEGYIKRKRSPTDERVVELFVTPLGEEKMAVAKAEMQRIIDEFTGRAQPGQLETILNGFNELENLLSQVAASAAESEKSS